MLKVWIVVVVLVAPILCEKDEVEEMVLKRFLTEECLATLGTHRMEYINCMKVINRTEFIQDVQKCFSESPFNSSPGIKRNEFLAVAEKYCPKMKTTLKCNEVLTANMPEDCLPGEMKTLLNIAMQISSRTLDFFCKNNLEEARNFIDDRIIECGIDKKNDLMECLDKHQPQFLANENKIDTICGSIGSLDSCIVSTFEQCSLSSKAGTFVKSFIRNMQKGTECENFTRNVATGRDINVMFQAIVTITLLAFK